MMPVIEELIGLGHDFYHQEDNDPKHEGERCCNLVKNFIRTRNKKIAWQSQAPDLKPIEHVDIN